jgi:hypothetical protein
MLSQQRAVHEYDRAGGKYTRDKPSLFVPYQHYSPAPSFILVLLRLLLSFLLLFSFYTTVHLLSLLPYSSPSTLLLVPSRFLHIFLDLIPFTSYISSVPLTLYCSAL